MMKLYLIYQYKNVGYDTYDSAVVAAENADAARMTHPSESYIEWNGDHLDFDGWCAAAHVGARLLGKAVDGTQAGVICASFNAG